MILAGLNSVISLYYYLRVVKVMFLEGERSETIIQPPAVMMGMLLLTAIPTVLFGIYWSPIANWINHSMIFFIQAI